MSINIWENDEHHEQWDDFLHNCPQAHFWQLHGWLSSYRPMGLDSTVITKVENGKIIAGVAVVSYDLPLRAGKIFILPHGPVCQNNDDALFKEIMDALADYCRQNRAIYIQVWPHAEVGDETTLSKYIHSGFTGPQLFHSHVFSSTVLAIDIGRYSQEEILAASRRNTRYYGRLAMRSGLEICVGDSDEFLEQCHQVWQEALSHYNTQVRPLASYKIALERLIKKGNGLLFQARKDGQIAGALSVLFTGDTTLYFMGGVRRKFSKFYPSEFLHLSAMDFGRQRGLKTYDFNNMGKGGTAQFKRGFRPIEKHWASPRTLVFKPLTSNLISWAEQNLSGLARKVARRRANRH